MKIFLPFLLFLEGLLSEKTFITKQDGETVTLLLNQEGLDLRHFIWTYGPLVPISVLVMVANSDVVRVNGTRFEDRLRIHVETGSITINNLTIHDTGNFLIQVFTESGTWNQTYNLTVCANRIIEVNGLVGDNVVLDTGVKELQKDHKVIWTKGRDFVGISVAEWEKNITTIIPSFQGILYLDWHTGSLTFINIKSNVSGYYCVKMLLWGDPHILRQYALNVYDPVPKPHISGTQVDDGTCSVTCSSQNAPSDTLSWYRGEKKINQTCDPDMSRNLSLLLKIKRDIQEKDIYKCEASNPVDRKTVTLNSTAWCPLPNPAQLQKLIYKRPSGYVVNILNSSSSGYWMNLQGHSQTHPIKSVLDTCWEHGKITSNSFGWIDFEMKNLSKDSNKYNGMDDRVQQYLDSKYTDMIQVFPEGSKIHRKDRGSSLYSQVS
ncbi:uncharacterized protein LOC117526647 [Thalassophryne amazonica]|uniref:uncharacterized protein LOC117526647 n=1 Tax=Thalassophryne amazonica TaxID=390379 RepID=UPI0014721E3E|nr:uncharacterized protein LOC117526647 [Thalassophryne amazonica]